MLKFLVGFLLLLSTINADARGGRNTTFDINSEGGNWTCFGTVGVCGAGFSQYWNATCDGTTSDATAQYAWIAYGHARGAAQSKLYIPPRTCVLDTENDSLVADLRVHWIDNGIQNAVIWGYGARFNSLTFGGWGYGNAVSSVSGLNTTALFQTVSAGSSTVTLVTASDSALFTTNVWVALTAQTIQTFGGNPSNQTFFEYNYITNINAGTGVITFAIPLSNNYKSTYPQLDPGNVNFINQGGPATIYLLEPTWNTNARFMGMLLTHSTGLFQPLMIGKHVVAQDVQFGSFSNFAPTASKDLWIINSGVGNYEIDKNIQNLWSINNSNTNQMSMQSGSVNLVIQGGNSVLAMNGTPRNTSISNFTVSAIRAGPTVSGTQSNLSLDGVTVTSSLDNPKSCNISDFSFSLGILTIAKASGAYDCSTRLWVPGSKYYMGDIDGRNTCQSGGPHTFTVSDIVDAGANVNINTDIASIPVALTCPNGVRAPTTFGAYQTLTYTSKFSTNINLNPGFIAP